MTAAPLAALADPSRRVIFERLVSAGPRSVGELAGDLPISRPAVSQHLKVLVEAGLVAASAEGTRRIYGAEPAGLAALRGWVEQQWDTAFGSFERAAHRRAAVMNQPTSMTAAVRKTCTVPLPVQEAFRLFTDGMDQWWPVATHSITADDPTGGGSRVRSLRFEGHVGGRVVEVVDDGQEHSWGNVLAWDPPHRFVMSWHPNRAPTAASRVEVRFRATPAGTTVELEHSGWEEFGDRGPQLRDAYERGWDPVLERLVAVARDARPVP